MSAQISMRAMLAEGRHKLSLGRQQEVLERVLAQPRLLGKVVECLWDEDEGVASRASDVVEDLFRMRPQSFAAWKEPFLGLMAETTTQKVRWRLAVIVPRLHLNADERLRVAALLESFLDLPGSIVRTCALDGLGALAESDAEYLPLALDLLRLHGRSGTPAMRARSRQILARLEKRPKARDL